MGKITIKMDSVEAYYAVNTISVVQDTIDKVVKKGKRYHDRSASLEALKQQIKKALKEQADIEDLRKGLKIIES